MVAGIAAGLTGSARVHPSCRGSKSDQYERHEKIGEGTYGVVYKALDLNQDMPVALKRIRLEVDNEGIPPTAIREIAILKELTHPNVVRLLDVFFKDANLFLVFEYVNTDLKHFMDARRRETGRPLSPAVTKSFGYQLMRAVAYCHSKRVLHRDLKPQNILVDAAGASLKLADFGLARAFQIPLRDYTHEVITLWYRAPEILLGAATYSCSVDVWSAGLIIAELCSGSAILPGDSEIDQLYRIFRTVGTPTEETWPGVTSLPEFSAAFPQWPGQSWSKLLPAGDPLLLDLLARLVVLDPAKRMTARDALDHPYFAGCS